MTLFLMSTATPYISPRTTLKSQISLNSGWLLIRYKMVLKKNFYESSITLSKYLWNEYDSTSIWNIYSCPQAGRS